MNFIITKVGFSITICSWERTNSTAYGDGDTLNRYYEIHYSNLLLYIRQRHPITI
ncbi:hypothetical protein [Oceanobacillus alkalisoli]|uniref:hypothetical protein n=1 Tax=Oceanobacillus alkalisoli TaxID=2925113 RepID=UPI001EE4D811|nr:hypothetical protein [Oceanobacillus alkalisoli]MCG5102448.1 hypothetical protein [Oceanobacillus alkalisoli]